MVFSVIILVQFHLLPFIIIPTQYLGDHKIVGKWFNLNKYKEFPQYIAAILYTMDIIVLYSPGYGFMENNGTATPFKIYHDPD